MVISCESLKRGRSSPGGVESPYTLVPCVTLETAPDNPETSKQPGTKEDEEANDPEFCPFEAF